jgi:hypothetical protein
VPELGTSQVELREVGCRVEQPSRHPLNDLENELCERTAFLLLSEGHRDQQLLCRRRHQSCCHPQTTKSAEIGALTVLQEVTDPKPLCVVHRQLIDLLQMDEP